VSARFRLRSGTPGILRLLWLALAAAAALPAAGLRAQQVADGTRVGSFVYWSAKDPMDDHDVSFVVVDASEGLVPPQLAWRCGEAGAYLLYLSQVPITRDSVVEVTYRFDQAPAQQSQWVVTAGYAWATTVDANYFTTTAREARTLAMRVTTSRGEQVTAVFSLDGADRAMNLLPCLHRDTPAAPPPP
jgi:hypothetical protein